MPLFRLLWKAPLIMALICLYLVLAAMGQIALGEKRGTEYTVWLSHYMAKVWNWVLNIHIEHAIDSLRSSQGNILVSNHLSYLDVPIILAQTPARFITSVEIRDTFGLGLFCRLSACLFVERRRKAQLPAEISKLRSELAAGTNIGLFPEATSGNGNDILSFKNALLEAAVGVPVKVLPLCINYLRVDGMPLTKSNHHRICWYGDMDFIPHFIGVLSASRIDVALVSGDHLDGLTFHDRKQLSARARNEIVRRFHAFQ